MANYWAAQGHTVTLLSLDSPDRTPFFPLHPRVTYIALDLLYEEKHYQNKMRRTIYQIKMVRRSIKKHRPKVIIAQLDIAIFLAITASQGLHTRVIISERTNIYLSQTNKYLKKLNSFLYQLADHIVLQTHQIAATFPRSLQKKISVIYNPVAEPTEVLQSGDYLTNMAHKKIASIGRLVFPKAYEVLVEAFAEFSENRPEWTLLIMGEGEERPRLEKLCRELNITERVSLPGTVNDPLNTLRSCSIFVLSSRYEGLPNTLCEAMSIGMPVIATRCQFGPEEIVQHNENGLLVPVEDVTALAEAMTALANDAQRCQRLGTNARQINERLNINTIMQQWETVIQSVLTP